MVTRIHLGWNEPFVVVAARWLLEQPADLTETLVIVPTSQSGRQLRYQMAITRNAVLSPRITTPGALLATDAPDIAPDWVEQLAWHATLDSQSSWPAALFPEPPPDGAEWTSGFAAELLQLRRKLQENGHTLQSTARVLAASVEANRWHALAGLEQTMEQTLRDWGYRSRSRALQQGIPLPDNCRHIVLAGTTDIPPVLERQLLNNQLPITTLIGAPESEQASFSETGRPLEPWLTHAIPWPPSDRGGVYLTADTRQQAQSAMALVATAATAAGHLALGTADTSAGDAIRQEFCRAGWSAYHPASPTITTGLMRWLHIWLNWLQDPKLETMVDLLALPETSALLPHHRARLAEKISGLRDHWMAARADDLRHRLQHDPTIREHDRIAADTVIKAATTLEQWRSSLLRPQFLNALERLLDKLAETAEETADDARKVRDWLEQAQPLIRKVDRPTTFWLRLMLQHLPAEPSPPPAGRVIDVQGWLELFFEPGHHLVVCGLNEGMVPASHGGAPWLGESAKAILGLPNNAHRHARDAFLLHSMIETRRKAGRCDILLAKAKANGEPMLPSRLLLAADQEELPARVKLLFRSIEPPDAGLRWEKDWSWVPPRLDPPVRFNATAFRDYLACPFRYYLKHVLRMQAPDPRRIEWNQRDFGNVTHAILERWGNDPVAREFENPDTLRDWLSDALNQAVSQHFGTRIPLAVRIQTESLRQRLSWFADHQSRHHADGWQVIEVEHRFEIPSGNATIRAVIDRIDRHRDTGELKIIDYKTGSMKGRDVAQWHRSEIRSNTKLPAHISNASPAVYEKPSSNGKSKTYRWTNLQLPLYCAAIQREHPRLATPCYFKIGDNQPESGIDTWDDFDAHDLDSAQACADWVVAQVAAGVFTPPAEKVEYTDYDLLLAGRPIHEMFDTSSLLTPAESPPSA